MSYCKANFLRNATGAVTYRRQGKYADEKTPRLSLSTQRGRYAYTELCKVYRLSQAGERVSLLRKADSSCAARRNPSKQYVIGSIPTAKGRSAVRFSNCQYPPGYLPANPIPPPPSEPLTVQTPLMLPLLLAVLFLAAIAEGFARECPNREATAELDPREAIPLCPRCHQSAICNTLPCQCLIE